MEDEEESKYERDFGSDMNTDLQTTTEPHKERLLDAIYLDVDMDETKSIIWYNADDVSGHALWNCIWLENVNAHGDRQRD